MEYSSWSRATPLEVVEQLRRDIDATTISLPGPGPTQTSNLRRDLLGMVDERVLPKMRELSRPTAILVCGPTGAGKSTITNSLIGQDVAAVGVLRPTTRHVAGFIHPDVTPLFDDHPMTGAVAINENPAVPRGVVIVDSPDFDSAAVRGESRTAQLVQAADLLLYVTTPARYADSLAWDFLRHAATRGKTIAIVLNRADAASADEVRNDLAVKLHANGLAQTLVFVINSVEDPGGHLPAGDVLPVREWLGDITGPQRVRIAVTVAMSDILSQVADVAQRFRAEVVTAIGTADALGAAYDAAVDQAAALCAHSDSLVAASRAELAAAWRAEPTPCGVRGILAGGARLFAGRGRDRANEFHDLAGSGAAVNHAAQAASAMAATAAKAYVRESLATIVAGMRDGSDQSTGGDTIFAAVDSAARKNVAPRDTVARWRASVRDLIDSAGGGPAFVALRQSSGMAATLAAAGALGNADATASLARMARADAQPVVRAARESFGKHLMTAALDALAPFAEVIRGIHSDPQAPTRLESDLTEIRRLAQ